MAQIYNSELSKELQEAGKVQISRDNIPNQLAEKVVPVIEVNPKLLRRTNVCKSYSATVTGNAVSLYTAETGKDFYLTSFCIAYTANAACDVASGYWEISATINGIATPIAAVPRLTLTAQGYVLSGNFSTPIKIDRGTNITAGAFSFTAGAASRIATIQGYTVDNINA